MKPRHLSLALALAFSGAACTSSEPVPEPEASPEEIVREHLDAAREAAGSDHLFVLGQLCSGSIEAVSATAPDITVPGSLPATDPEREWYTDPVQVFDDLFYLGQTQFSAWGLRTSEGIIVVDAIFDYSAEAEIIDGLERLGIDPGEIRYVIISHAHGDHSGGAGVLQQHGAQVVMSEADWDLYESNNSDDVVATRDIVATDGMELELGGHVVRTYLTPGHTHGTLSTILPVHDGGEEHVAALWGGTLFNFRDAPDDPRLERLATYADSARRFRDVATEAGADIILSNHPTYDGSTVKIPMLAGRGEDDPHPYVIGNDGVRRYLTVAEECAEAALVAEREMDIQ